MANTRDSIGKYVNEGQTTDIIRRILRTTEYNVRRRKLEEQLKATIDS